MKIHTVEGKQLEFNDENLVAVYQEKYRLYDRFLPHLASYLEGAVVDVGANCGALAVAMGVKNPSLEFVCIEPEDKHLLHLHKNVLQISNKVQVDKAKIGTQYKLLDKVLEQFDVKNIGLLKVDVDGYDWDVLDSYSFTQKPPIYIEEDFKEPWQYEKYFAMNQRLSNLGYNNIWMFDNFGCLIGFTKDWDMVNTLNSYVNRTKAGNSAVTFWYMDLLICQDADVDRLANGVLTYITS
jgi:hypothetical protein